MNRFWISALTLVILACVVVSGCSSPLKQPTVTVTNVVPTKVSLSELAYDVTVSVENPNPVGITLKTLDFDIYYQDKNDWVYLSHGEKSDVEIKPGSNVVTIPFTVSSAELVRSLGTFVSSGEITLQVRGTAAPDLLGFAPKIPFTYTRTVPLKAPPSS
jgi:LEA14-like dessication related protein